MDSKSIADFVDSGRDLILSADTSAYDLIRGIALECGVDFDGVRLSLSSSLERNARYDFFFLILLAIFVFRRILRLWLLIIPASLSLMLTETTP